MKTILIIATTILISSCMVKAQGLNITPAATYGYMGFGWGQETFISGAAPKMGLIRKYEIKEFPLFEPYIGSDLTIGLLIGFWVSSSTYAGIKVGPFTIDNSISYLALKGQEWTSQLTANPKFGVDFKSVWLKMGPSYLLSHKRALPDFSKVNQTYYNIELIIPIR